MIPGGINWTHRFFWCQRTSTKWVCRYQIKNTNFWLPRSFVWTLWDDPDTLKIYIDALVTGNKTVSALWEQKGAAVDHEWEAEPANGVVRLDHVMLAAFLRGEFVLEVPAHGRVILSGKGQQMASYMPQEVQAGLIADEGPLHDMYLQRLQHLVGAGRPIIALEKEKFQSGAAKIQAYHPGASIAVAPPAEQGVPSVAEENPETEVARFEHEGYLETIFSRGEYFVRRLNALDHTPFWAGSSYSAHGPWEQFFVDQPLYDALMMQHEAAV